MDVISYPWQLICVSNVFVCWVVATAGALFIFLIFTTAYWFLLDDIRVVNMSRNHQYSTLDGLINFTPKLVNTHTTVWVASLVFIETYNRDYTYTQDALFSRNSRSAFSHWRQELLRCTHRKVNIVHCHMNFKKLKNAHMVVQVYSVKGHACV